MKEAAFLAGLFFDFDVPREKKFLFQYFTTPLEIQFVKYYFCFNGEIEKLIDHTGCFCQQRWLRILKKRVEKMLKMHADLKLECLENESAFVKLMALEKGKHKV